MELRYMGFDQAQNTRAYRFKGIANGEPAAYFIITADLALFLANRISIQEGPGLCAHKLAADLLSALPGNHQLTNADMIAHTDARALIEARKAESRKNGVRRRAAAADA